MTFSMICILLSSARGEDYASLENVTNVVAQYAKKHVERWWLSTKYVALGLLEQWPNLKEYFLNFLPKQSNFESEITKTYRYIRIKNAVEEPLTKVYVFLCFYCTRFWVFSFTFASRSAYDPLVVSFYVQIIEWQSIKISQEKKNLFCDLESNIYIDVSKKENLKPLNLIGIDTKAKLMFPNSTFFPDEKQTKFREDCLKFYVAAVQHLQSKLPLDIPFIKHAQFLHPEKHQLPGATNAISNLELSICSVHKIYLQNVFLTRSPVTH